MLWNGQPDSLRFSLPHGCWGHLSFCWRFAAQAAAFGHSSRRPRAGRWRRAWRYLSKRQFYSTRWTVFAPSPSAHPLRWPRPQPSSRSAFQARLLQRRPFREVKALPYEVKSDAEALWYARSEGCELAMVPVLLYMMDGTGGMPTKLVVRIRILDARTVKCPLGHQTERATPNRVPISTLTGIRSRANLPRGAE